ncbi:hypothetical protein TSMEX_005099 [Taenia solium]|eukprot:TsM_000426600 transcript=TsM_000426600 gene=TsM_000426600
MLVATLGVWVTWSANHSRPCHEANRVHIFNENCNPMIVSTLTSPIKALLQSLNWG